MGDWSRGWLDDEVNCMEDKMGLGRKRTHSDKLATLECLCLWYLKLQEEPDRKQRVCDCWWVAMDTPWIRWNSRCTAGARPYSATRCCPASASISWVTSRSGVVNVSCSCFFVNCMDNHQLKPLCTCKFGSHTALSSQTQLLPAASTLPYHATHLRHGFTNSL
jgi:hypothetical protein